MKFHRNRLQETIQGASSVRAYHVVDEFLEESARRIDENLACYYPSIVANRFSNFQKRLSHIKRKN